MGLLWDLTLSHPKKASPSLADSAIKDGEWREGLPCHFVVGPPFAETCPWTHLPGFTRGARVVGQAGGRASGLCVWCVLGASALCQAVERGVDEMTAVLALTLLLEGRQSTQRKDWREVAEAICVLHSL